MNGCLRGCLGSWWEDIAHLNRNRFGIQRGVNQLKLDEALFVSSIGARTERRLTVSEVFSKLNIFIFGYFDPVNNFFDNKHKSFSG